MVQLQAYDEDCIFIWKQLYQISRNYFNTIYDRLGITLEEFGESFYNKMISPIIEELDKKGMIVEDSTVTKKPTKKKAKKDKDK